MVYVSSDQDQAAFDRYFGSFVPGGSRYAVPYTAKDRKEELDRHFKVPRIRPSPLGHPRFGSTRSETPHGVVSRSPT